MGLPGVEPVQSYFNYFEEYILGLMCLAQGHNAVMPMRLEPAALLVGVKHSTTEPMGSLYYYGLKENNQYKFAIIMKLLLLSTSSQKTKPPELD